ncbi:MAG: 3,4-dihydroxy-2-butanone-4-phosphate synthase [Hyphomonas sp.]|jgi:3,4-dihydroxy 2-butanone 4-phosphate synthase/GTP cyclohydrolase II|nr:3,4-dihydroxy-2-butanone-4-phosphate synthase [Hyphomonas sp.]
MTAHDLITKSDPAPGQPSSTLASADELIAEFAKGRMIVLIDRHKEGQGDLVIPAQMATPDAVNFMATHGRGLICLALTQTRAEELKLEFVVRHNSARNRTDFAKSIEASTGITTGISARDRARTIATAIDPSKGPGDIVSPGHMFPLVARPGGVLVRAGHTEASVDLARLAGLIPAAVICEILDDRGGSAKLPQLLDLAHRHGLKAGTIDSIIAHCLKKNRIVKQTAMADVVVGKHGPFTVKVFTSLIEPTEHLALVKGDITTGEPVLVRVQASDTLSDVLNLGLNAEGSGLKDAIEIIGRAGKGVVVLIRNANPRAMEDWARARSGQGPVAETTALRRQIETGLGSQILSALGVKDMILLSRSAPYDYAGLKAFGLNVVEERTLGRSAASQESDA